MPLQGNQAQFLIVVACRECMLLSLIIERYNVRSTLGAGQPDSHQEVQTWPTEENQTDKFQLDFIQIDSRL